MISVNARPEAWPAFRMLAISASLLKARTSLIMSRRGWSLLEGRRLAKPSALDVELKRKRDKTVEGAGERGMSV